MHTQYCIQNKRIGLYFPEQKLVTEINEYGHVDTDFEYKQSRQIMKEQKLDWRIIRTDSDTAEFNVYRLINQVRMNIKQLTIKSTKKLTKNLMINDLLKELVEAATELKSK